MTDTLQDDQTKTVVEEETALPSDDLPTSPASGSQIFQQYFDAIEAHEKATGRHKIEPGVYHASDAFYCNRQLAYKHRKVPEEGTKPLGLFAVGHFAEAEFGKALRAYYEPQGFDVLKGLAIEHALPNGGVIVGETDFFIRDRKTQKLVRQYEVKSNAKGRKASPHLGQKGQASVYAKKLDVDETRIVHPARNNLLDMPDQDYELPLSLRDELFDRVVVQFTELHAHLTNGTLPIAAPYMGWSCTYCPYPNRCQTDGGWRVGPKGGMKPPLPIGGAGDDDE